MHQKRQEKAAFFMVSVPGLTFLGMKGISNGAVCDLNDGGAADAITEGQGRKVK